MTEYPHQWTPGHVHEWVQVWGISKYEKEECWTCHRRRLTIEGKLNHAIARLFGMYVDALEAVRDIKRIMEITSKFKDENTEKNAKKEPEERV